MKSLTLAIISFFIFLFTLIIFNRIRLISSKQTILHPLLSFVMVAPVYFLLYFSTSGSLGLFSPQLLGKSLLADVTNGLLFYTCLCYGFTDFLIKTTIAPFSTDILFEIYQSGGKGLSESDLKVRYCKDDSDKGLVLRRILFLKKFGFICESSGEYLVPKKAMILAWIIQGLRKFTG